MLPSLLVNFPQNINPSTKKLYVAVEEGAICYDMATGETVPRNEMMMAFAACCITDEKARCAERLAQNKLTWAIETANAAAAAGVVDVELEEARQAAYSNVCDVIASLPPPATRFYRSRFVGHLQARVSGRVHLVANEVYFKFGECLAPLIPVEAAGAAGDDAEVAVEGAEEMNVDA